MFAKMKIELKENAIKIRAQKKLVKEKQREFGGWREQCRLHAMRWQYRHQHIAYCLLRGRVLDQIEKKSHRPPSEPLIEVYMAKAREAQDAAA